MHDLLYSTIYQEKKFLSLPKNFQGMPEDYNRTMVTRELVSLIHKKRNEGFSLPLIPQEEENKQNVMNFSNTPTAISAFSVCFFNGTIEGGPTFFCGLGYQDLVF